ncbi:MAG: formyltransferase family protein [Thermoplasmata archaeon]
MLKIGWFSTGRDEAARDLLTTVVDKIRDGTINGEIAFVFCNRERGEVAESDRFLDLVESYAFPIAIASSKDFKPEMRKEARKDGEVLRRWRLEYDVEIERVIAPFQWDLGVLAGYMLIVGEEFCQKHSLINLHPATPDGPKGSWQEVIWELIENQAEKTGVMMHLVTADLDRGPVITYCDFPIRGGAFTNLWTAMERKLETKTVSEIEKEEDEKEPLFLEIRKQGLIREFPLIVHTIIQFADNNLRIEGGQLIARGKPLTGGYCLSDDINKTIE